MFFIITSIFLNKKYPKIINQFIIACILYVITLIVIMNFSFGSNLNNYGYYAIALITVDILCFMYLKKIASKYTKTDKTEEIKLNKKSKNKQENKKNNLKLNPIKGDILNILKSENTNINSNSNSNSNSILNSNGSSTNKIFTPSLSEINDIKIKHDLSASETNDIINMFSTQDINTESDEI